jgi:hypothetical protein
MWGAWYRPVSARYDVDTDTTTRFYQPVAPADLPKNMLSYSARIMASRKDGQQWLKEVVAAYLADEKWRNTLQRFLTSLQSGVRRKKEAPAVEGLTKSQAESLHRLKKQGLSLPKHLDKQQHSGLILPNG